MKTTDYDSHPRVSYHLHQVGKQDYHSLDRSPEEQVVGQATALPTEQELALPLVQLSEQESVLSPEQALVQVPVLQLMQELGHQPMMTKVEAWEPTAVCLPYL
jgi:hypothetical protein